MNQTCLKTLIDSIISHAKSKKEKKFYSALTHATCWAIWKARNEANFRLKKQNPMVIVDVIQTLLFNWVKHMGGFHALDWFSWVVHPLRSGFLS